MENVVKFKKLPDNYRKTYISQGKNGSCFRIGQNKVFKEFNLNNFLEKSITRLSRLKIEPFVFPSELVYVDDNFVGYTMDFVDGVTLDQVKSIDLDNYLNEIRKLEYSISYLSILHYLILDFKERNIMFTSDNEFKVIDTDFYTYTDVRDLYRRNLASMATTITVPSVDVYSVNFKNRLLNYKNELLKSGRYLPSKYIIDIVNELYKYTNCEINSTSDIKNSIELILK